MKKENMLIIKCFGEINYLLICPLKKIKKRVVRFNNHFILQIF